MGKKKRTGGPAWVVLAVPALFLERPNGHLSGMVVVEKKKKG